MKKFKLPNKFNKNNNEMTAEQLRQATINSTGHHTLKGFAKQMSVQSLEDVLKDAKMQKHYFNLSCMANPSLSKMQVAGEFYSAILKQYQEIGYGQGAYFMVPMIAIAMQNELSDYFNTITYIEIAK